MLQPLRETFDLTAYPDLLVGLDEADDAAVYRLNDTQAVVITTDFFPPVVDDAYDFGSIAAANAMSDIYAMGARVLFAINLVAFPPNLDRQILREILRGGAEKVKEAGGIVVGGHSLEDIEPKYGLAVIGLIEPGSIKRKGGAQPGDVLVLTKPLGTGVVTTALKEQIAEPAHVEAAIESMKRLNKNAAEAALAVGARGMTDVTGFGLLGHAREMAKHAKIDFVFEIDRIRWLPGAVQYGEEGAFPGGMGRNLEYFAPHVFFDDDIPVLYKDLLWTPETSGGLLVTLPPAAVGTFQKQCPVAFVVGRVEDGQGRLYVTSRA